MSETYKAVIIDDELRARKLLSGILHEYAQNIRIVAECADLPEAVKAIRKHKPDLIFLDIEMPGHSGLELLNFFDEEEIDFEIIFTTAYDQYAIRAFRLSAIDYLLKPIDTEELQQAMLRFEKKKNGSLPNIAALRQNLTNTDANKIAVAAGNTFRFLELATVLYLKADNAITEIHFNDGSKLSVSRTLTQFEEVLGRESGFFRCHKSYMVNTNHITEYVKTNGGYLLLNGKIVVPISSEKAGELLSVVKTIKH